MGTIEERDCKSLREALIITAPGTKPSGPDAHLAYTYIGGGVPWQPPFTFPLVTKELPIAFADHMMAVFVALGWTHVSVGATEDIFVRRQNRDVKDVLSCEEKQRAIATRKEAIQLRAIALKERYETAQHLLDAVLPPEDHNMLPLVDSAL